jgi:SH3-like domain-containing protein
LHQSLSGRRTALVLRTEKRENAKIYASAGESAHLAATLQSEVIVSIRSCDGAWRLVDGDGFNGYIPPVKCGAPIPTRRLNERACTGESNTA